MSIPYLIFSLRFSSDLQLDIQFDHLASERKRSYSTSCPQQHVLSWTDEEPARSADEDSTRSAIRKRGMGPSQTPANSPTAGPTKTTQTGEQRIEEVMDYRTYCETMAGLLQKPIVKLLRNLKISRNVKWIYQEGISISGRCSLPCFNGKLQKPSNSFLQ